jgi:hypothetical protein
MVQNRDYGPLASDKLTTTDYARQDNQMDKRLPTYRQTHTHTHETNVECICTQSPNMEIIHSGGWMEQSTGSNHGNVTNT